MVRYGKKGAVCNQLTVPLLVGLWFWAVKVTVQSGAADLYIPFWLHYFLSISLKSCLVLTSHPHLPCQHHHHFKWNWKVERDFSGEISFSLCYGEGSLCILQRLFFPFSCQRIFHWENLVGFLTAKPLTLWGAPLRQVPQDFITLMLVHAQPPPVCLNFHLKVSASLLLKHLLLQISRSQLRLSSFTCLSEFHGGTLLCNLIALKCLQKPVNLSTCAAFLFLCKGRNDDFQAL